MFGDRMKKIMFDCDDTLYDLSWPFQQCIQDLLPEALSLDLNAFYADYRKFGDEIFGELQKGNITIDESGIYRIQKACEKYRISFPYEKCVQFQKRYKYYQHHIQMDSEFTGYFSTTQDKIAILTNGEDSHQRMKLQVLRVFDYFKEDHVFTSGQIGFAKPDPKAFQTCMDRMHEDISQWYYVGDNYINDMQGAKKAGMKTIHFNRHHQLEGDASDYVVYSAKDLIQLIQSEI